MNRFLESWLTIKASSEAEKIKKSRPGMAKAKRPQKIKARIKHLGHCPPFVSTKEQIENPLFLVIIL